jgi:hypothetical protein
MARAAAETGGPRQRCQQDELAPDPVVDVGDRLGADAGCRAGRQERLLPRGLLPVEFSERQARDLADVLDNSRLGDMGEDVGDAAHDAVRPQGLAEHAFGLDAVLQRHYGGLGRNERAKGLG